jgi:hypothetical protein
MTLRDSHLPSGRPVNEPGGQHDRGPSIESSTESRYPASSHAVSRSSGSHPATTTSGSTAAGLRPSVPSTNLATRGSSKTTNSSRIEELAARAAELGQPALALIDHDGLYGAVRFAKACAKHGIKPIFGAEVRVQSLLAVATRADASPRDDPHHLVFLAESREGYANFYRILSAAHLNNPERERPPLVTLESLTAHAAGLICLTACRHGEVGYLTDTGRGQDACAALVRLRNAFGAGHLYVELQYFGYEPHHEAKPGQHGSPVYEKTHADGGACATGRPPHGSRQWRSPSTAPRVAD